jgi:hypothetical protein
MYSHIFKGYTVGQTLTRRVLRNLTGLPGILFDTIAAFFWKDGFSHYWQNARMPFNDDETTTIFRGLFGWIGEVAGYFLGAFVGSVIGLICFIPDFFITQFFSVYQSVLTRMDEFSQLVGKHSKMADLRAIETPHNYAQKSWNVSLGTLGLLLGGTFYYTARFIETFLPIGHLLSHTMGKLGGYMGGCIGWIISLPLYPLKNLITKAANFYKEFRDNIRSIVAFIYVKTKQEPAKENDCECLCADTAMHSVEFRQKVEIMKQNSTSVWLLGELKRNPPTNPESEIKDNVPLVCPITLTRFVKPVVDRAGHTFEESAIKEWLHRGNKTCPVGTEPLMENDLIVNRALVSVLERR